MKRLVILSIFLLSLLSANPIDPRAYLSELQIMTPKNWIMEIGDDYSMFSYWDSVYVEGRLGSEKLININRDDSTGYILITPGDLSDSLEFDNNNDRIQVTFFSSVDQDYSNYVIIGDYPGSYLHDIDASQSLAVSGKYPPFFKDNTPTFGSRNTFEGGLGKIYGYFYSSHDNPINNKRLYIEMAAFSGYVDSNGYYEYEMPSRYYYADSIFVYPIDGNWQYINIQNLEFDLEPGDSIEIDIYQLISSIRPVIQNNIKLNSYPHPASSYTWIYIDNTEVDASAMRVNVYAMNGRKVDSFIPSAKHFRYDCGHLPQGSYVLSLQHGHEVLASKKLQIIK